jgi:pyruvate-formate lyase
MRSPTTAALPTEELAYARRFTHVHEQHRDAPPAVRELACTRVMLESGLQPIGPQDLFAGSLRYPMVGFSSERGGLGYYCQALNPIPGARLKLSSQEREVWAPILDYWRQHGTAAKVRAAYALDLAATLPSDDLVDQPGIAWPLYRMAGGQMNMVKLCRLGINGLVAEIQAARAKFHQDDKALPLFDAMLGSLDLFRSICDRYAQEARAQARDCPSEDRRLDLLEMARCLDVVRHQPPRHLREAMQLGWLWQIVSHMLNFGRLDVTLGDFYAQDLDSGHLTESQALRLICGFWRQIDNRRSVVNGRVYIGGMGRPNIHNADRFALAAMEATRVVHLPEPQLSLRFHTQQNPALMRKALDVLAEGCTFPILYNDDVNVPAVMHAFGVTRQEAEQYVPLGCGEYMLEHRSFHTPSGAINLLQALLVTLNDGIDPGTGQRMGLALGSLRDFKTYDELWSVFRQQVEHHIQAMARMHKLEYDVVGQECSLLFLSMLYDDCIERGRAMFDGGCRHLGGTLEFYGVTNTADSLTALRQLVYESRSLAAADVLEALQANFSGLHAALGRLLREAPKFGNDDARADDTAVAVPELICRSTMAMAPRVGLDSYLLVNINNSCNTVLGKQTAASPDGRPAFTSMANANNPSPGMDRSGVTAFFNSMLKMRSDIHAGLVQNMKFGPEMFRDDQRSNLTALLDTYWAQGGTQAMITVVGRGELEAALREPEKYANLIVRVGGFSARFVELPREVQMEILARTLN